MHAVDTNADLGGQKINVFETLEMGIRHNRVTTRDFSVAGFIFTYVQKYFSGLTGGGDRRHRPPWIRHWA